MRVISGKLKGREIKGFDISGTRPTMDRVKESLFAMIQNYLNEAVCLDLFGGSGNLGIEAISNGACKVYFNDIQGSSFMEIDAEIFNNYINDETSMGRIIFSNYKNNFFENQYVISLISLEDIYRKEKKYEVIEVERLGKKHRYELLKELKNILM